jgi:dTDP-glucose pyrophosphorylase
MNPLLRQRIEHLVISPSTTLLDALRQMHRNEAKLLIVARGDRFESLVSVGDIQRAIIRQAALDSPVSGSLRPNIRVASTADDPAEIRRRMVELRTEFMPVLDRVGDLSDVIFWEDIVSSAPPLSRERIDIPVVVMAGGEGTRLRPLTHVLPKPLIPIGEQSIIEEIMDRFHACGATGFLISLNYKAEMIEHHLAGRAKPYRMEFIHEDRPLGTAGALRLMRHGLPTTFFVTNCDIVVEQDYAAILRQHREEGNAVTAVAGLAVQNVPYGVFECDAEGGLLRLREKPDLSTLVNVGLYVLEPRLLDAIPTDQPFNITELLEQARARGERIGLFPVAADAWTDIGEWRYYLEAIARHGRLPAK